MSDIQQQINAKLFNSIEVSKYRLVNNGATIGKSSDHGLSINLSAELYGMNEPLKVDVNTTADLEIQDGILLLKALWNTQFQLIGGIKAKLLEAIAAPVLKEPLEQNIIQAANGIVLSNLNTKEKWWADFMKFATIKSITNDHVLVKISIF